MSEKCFYIACGRRTIFIALILCMQYTLYAQQQYELNSGWQCIRASSLKKSGEEISGERSPLKSWLPAVVPGTVLTALLYNKLIPDPFYGMNNKLIPDIYTAGKDYYTYWFVKDFTEKYPLKDEHISVLFRGINNSADIFLNGHKLNSKLYRSMYLRQEYDITPFLAKDGHNRLAVIVYPPDTVGNPNGGQGGDGTIAHNITNQYVAGWDWIQPVHDRNTGIWDKVFIKKTKQVSIANTHIITLVPGTRLPEGKQAPATIKVTAEVENTSDNSIAGILQYELAGKKLSVKVSLAPHTKQLVSFPDLILNDPKLWWPNGYGPQNLYNLKTKFLINGITSDEEQTTFGVRQLKAIWNTHTQSRELQVNGQKIFIKGGNRILSDEMLRFSKDRYDAEVRYHHDMNLNMIRVWGGGITERPEFYDACDKYGILVFQDFWVSGDCNGRWDDPMKLEDTNARRNYPDDHHLFVASLADQIKMLRNHPSLAYWCGGNEIRPPADVLAPLKDSLLPELDGTRFFFEYSNDDSMSFNSGDGPYTIQPDTFFWSYRSFPFNSEVGSIGIGDYESLERFLPKENMLVPQYDIAAKKWEIDSVWQYHKYIGYDSAIEAYGHPNEIIDFTKKAQLVNYNQYRALIEGATAHMWDWYTGIIIWKTQNPWTAMLGQMYDVYLDPNACMYGLSEGAKPLHIMFDPVKKTIIIANNTNHTYNKVKERLDIRHMNSATSIFANSLSIPPNSCITDTVAVNDFADPLNLNDEHFFCLSLFDSTGEIDQNIYWIPGADGTYSWLNNMLHPRITASARSTHPGEISVTINNPDVSQMNELAFFMHVYLVDKKTKERILPVFSNNNYISVLPGRRQTVHISFSPQKGVDPVVCIEGWNVEKQFVELKK